MKTEHTIRNLVGLKQEEMARLLNISRAQWSMYESGKRNLPPHATLLLAELLTHLNKVGSSKQKQKTPDDSQLRKLELERLLKENHYQQLLIERKIEAIKKKQTATANFSHLADFVTSRNENGKTNGKPLLLFNKNDVKAKNETSTLLVSYELKHELLQLEKTFLEEKLKDIVQKYSGDPNPTNTRL